MEYEILTQSILDERVFKIKDKDGNVYNVDLYTDGQFEAPEGADATIQSWKSWLKETFEGKKIYIERLSPHIYFSAGETHFINLTKE